MRIHLITPIVTEGIRTLDDVAALNSADLSITQSLIASGPVSIECEFDEALSVPGIVEEAIAAERSGADAIIIDCMGDPGLKAAREVVSIPVLGPSETSMHLAAMLGHKYSVVTVLDSVVPMIENLAKIYGTNEKLVSVRVINIPVLELEAAPERLMGELAKASLAAVEEDGAHAIVLGCTGFLGCAEAISAELEAKNHNLPVIDPIPATVCVAAGIVRAGLTHSKRSYAQPRSKDLKGYPSIKIQGE
ncbi:aspartate/glutamate racemase family protein [Sphingorhabdus sp. SMR4y]|uniref:aspartate/glutamate racemase family protein n=1 Tax=Sphingorhabdus sp. SMR4y TaxID=2584094 RepID=UPI000B5C9867|nr:aspartate/glutamate racemase family protein [Sphingorhabdus sp. SMR4y]ASK89311.1 Asp/Glu/Hydantoin racemase [Sphingorhabdus sp. SMR4y]